jgi:hypothetical protein
MINRGTKSPHIYHRQLSHSLARQEPVARKAIKDKRELIGQDAKHKLAASYN